MVWNSFCYRSIDAAAPDQSWPESNGNERVLHSSNSKTWASPPDVV